MPGARCRPLAASALLAAALVAEILPAPALRRVSVAPLARLPPLALDVGAEGVAACYYDRASCKARAEALGLRTSRAAGSTFAFVGDYATKGCYAYRSGKWAGDAYYGTIDGRDLTGAEEQNNDFFPGGYRLHTCDTRAEEAQAGQGQAASPRAVLFSADGRGLQGAASVVADTVMGGRSSAQVSRTADGLLFEGFVTRENGGGFASVRVTPDDVAELARRLRAGSGVAFLVRHLRGCAAWKVQLTGSRGWLSGVVQWQADFTASGAGATQQVAFADLVPTRYGKPVGGRGMGVTDLEHVTSFGFMLSFLDENGASSAAFQEGSFAVSIALVEVV